MFISSVRPLVFSKASLSFLPYLDKGSGALEKYSNLVNNYLHLGGEKSIVIKGASENTFVCVNRIAPISCLNKTLKILSFLLIIPIILSLFIIIILRIVLFFKYRKQIIRVKEEELTHLLSPSKESLSLPLASPKALKKIHALHALIRSGKTYNELIQEGFSFIKITTHPDRPPSSNQDLGFSYNKLFPGFYFHSLIPISYTSGDERALKYHLDKQQEATARLEKTPSCSIICRSQYFPPLNPQDQGTRFGLVGLVQWKIDLLQE
ncbi:Family of unknown function (DUF648) [Chlamydia serpentis]|uniref:Uncharacterized protein n=1 Tax=Chlamydia serpentis TaxID=1967782 RepID=A0A2R8F9V6_9CHLA|nr:DUF648 domain-containing protein [Chlamydia serpentis]SPN73208.1 Family of unknown function (DUF648) [Chlamydia serpentis]